MNKTSKKESLRSRCERLSAEFSPLLAAKVRQTKAAQIMRARTSFKFRLNQLVSMDARLGQVWPVAECIVPLNVRSRAITRLTSPSKLSLPEYVPITIVGRSKDSIVTAPIH
jgi:hypothetical protein